MLVRRIIHTTRYNVFTPAFWLPNAIIHYYLLRLTIKKWLNGGRFRHCLSCNRVYVGIAIECNRKNSWLSFGFNQIGWWCLLRLKKVASCWLLLGCQWFWCRVCQGDHTSFLVSLASGIWIVPVVPFQSITTSCISAAGMRLSRSRVHSHS